MITTAYELMFIVKPNLDDEKANQVANKVKEVIEKNQGKINNFQFLGKKELASEFDHFRQGYYVLINFESEHHLPKILDQHFKITEEVLRKLLVKESSIKAKEQPEIVQASEA